MTETIPSWDEPTGATPRGTLIVLPGRGETPASYRRFGTRFASENWKVRLVPVDLAGLDDTRTEVEKLLADETLPSPKVLVGTDTGATFASLLINDVDADAAVLAGIALPDSYGVESWEDEVDARSACPLHRTLLAEDTDFGRGALNQPLPAAWAALRRVAPTKPVLVLHGTADPVTDLAEAVAPYVGTAAVVKSVQNGRHDVLNDIMHRAVAATIVLFIESLKLGSDLPAIVRDVA